MPERVRSQKHEQRNIRDAMWAKGESWTAIAEEFRVRYRCNARVAFRLAHGWSQREVADIWNARWPDEPRTHKNISYWELWPGSTGHAPSLDTLDRLARIYECSPADLLVDRPSFARRYAVEKTGIQPRLGDFSLNHDEVAQEHADVPPLGSVRADVSSRSVAQHDTVGTSTDAGAEDIDKLVEWITGSDTSDDAIDQIVYASSFLAKAHTRVAAEWVLREVLRVHREVQMLLKGRRRLSQTRELLRLDSELLAHACLLLGDLGHNEKAAGYGAAAQMLAREAGADEAVAWSAQAKTARWRGRYRESAEFARRGFEISGLTPTKIELGYREANSIALAGDARTARQVLRRADRAAAKLPADLRSSGTVWSFPVQRQAVFVQSVEIHAKNPDGALRAGAMAEVGWATGDPKTPANWAQIRVGSGIAYLMKGSLDGAADQISPVLGLEQALRISTVTDYLRRVDDLLAQPHFAKSAGAIELRQGIREFSVALPAWKAEGA